MGGDVSCVSSHQLHDPNARILRASLCREFRVFSGTTKHKARQHPVVDEAVAWRWVGGNPERGRLGLTNIGASNCLTCNLDTRVETERSVMDTRDRGQT